MIDKKEQGLFDKYYVHRVDGTDTQEGDKHFGCRYFVLDLTHDYLAAPALRAYANAAASQGYTKLPDDLRQAAERLEARWLEEKRSHD